MKTVSYKMKLFSGGKIFMDYLKDRVTIYEVAKASGVSLATVSRVINNQGNVTEATRKRVQDTIARLGYKPSGLAQALATSKSTTIGIVIPSANYVYISNFLNGITEIAKEKGYNLSLFVTSHSKEDARSVLEKVIKSHVDGAIVFDDELEEEDLSQLSNYAVPCIVVNNRIETEKIGCITFGYEHLLREIIRSHLEHEPDKMPIFLHVHNCGRLLESTERSFIRVCDEMKKEYRIINCDDSYTRSYQDFLEFFEEEKGGKFFIAYRDSIAAAVINAATDSGLNVPEDVEVMSLIGTKYASIIRPSITSMNIDMGEIGKRAMYMLIDLATGKLNNKRYKFESTYTKRDSTKE